MSNAKVFSEEETIITESITVVLSKAGWIRSAKGHEIDPLSLSYRGDDTLQDFARGKSNQLAVFLVVGIYHPVLVQIYLTMLR